MPREYLAIALGAISMSVSFVPSNIVQLAGIVVGLAGFRIARAVKREDYRKDFPCVVAQILGVAGALLCALGPALNLAGHVILWIAR